jgi:hypothetical protein
MKQRYLLIIFIGLLTFSCKKDDPTPKKDEIVYNDIIPDKEIQSVRYYTFQDHSVCTANVPTPSDSSITYDLDMDKDQVSDFKIRVAHSKYTDGYCGHCDRFTYNISIEGLSSNDSIANSPMQYWTPRLFSELDTIDKNNTWLSRTEILLLEGCSLPFQVDFTDGFIGIKIKNSYGYIRIEKMSNNGIRILEHGFNKTENNIIKCGQTE